MKVDVVDLRLPVLDELLTTLDVAGVNQPRNLAIAEVNHA